MRPRLRSLRDEQDGIEIGLGHHGRQPKQPKGPPGHRRLRHPCSCQKSSRASEGRCRRGHHIVSALGTCSPGSYSRAQEEGAASWGKGPLGAPRRGRGLLTVMSQGACAGLGAHRGALLPDKRSQRALASTLMGFWRTTPACWSAWWPRCSQGGFLLGRRGFLKGRHRRAPHPQVGCL